MTIKKIKPIPDENRLDKHVRCWINTRAADYDDASGPVKDLLYGGCQSGMVGHLIYYPDTVGFYKKYQSEITELLTELLNDTGISLPELFGDKWDDEDPLANEKFNQNLLSWFGFEETARRIAGQVDIEV